MFKPITSEILIPTLVVVLIAAFLGMSAHWVAAKLGAQSWVCIFFMLLVFGLCLLLLKV